MSSHIRGNKWYPQFAYPLGEEQDDGSEHWIVFHRIKEEHVQLVIENISDPEHRAAFESWMCFFRDQLEAGLELGECLFEGRKFSERHSDSAA